MSNNGTCVLKHSRAKQTAKQFFSVDKWTWGPGPASSVEDRSLCKNFVFLSKGSKHAVHQKFFQVR